MVFEGANENSYTNVIPDNRTGIQAATMAFGKYIFDGSLFVAAMDTPS